MAACDFILLTKVGLHVFFETYNTENNNTENERENNYYKVITKCDKLS